MGQPLRDTMRAPGVTTSSAWTYRPFDGAAAVEFASVAGHDVGLPTHFHDEDQVTFVTAGQRRFLLGGEIVVLSAGQSALIPAGVAHRSLGEPCGVACLNVYVPASRCALNDMLGRVARLWRRSGRLDPAELVAVIRDHRMGGAGRSPIRSDRRESVGQAAARQGLSREGFSRAFSRRHGMPPHAYSIVAKLNQARGLLRSGETLAAAAVDAGFVDQSHFGRCFRRVFGVSPGQYRSGWLTSQTYQTGHPIRR